MSFAIINLNKHINKRNETSRKGTFSKKKKHLKFKVPVTFAVISFWNGNFWAIFLDLAAAIVLKDYITTFRASRHYTESRACALDCSAIIGRCYKSSHLTYTQTIGSKNEDLSGLIADGKKSMWSYWCSEDMLGSKKSTQPIRSRRNNETNDRKVIKERWNRDIKPKLYFSCIYLSGYFKHGMLDYPSFFIPKKNKPSDFTITLLETTFLKMCSV